jgi:hypothetical protein
LFMWSDNLPGCPEPLTAQLKSEIRRRSEAIQARLLTPFSRWFVHSEYLLH